MTQSASDHDDRQFSTTTMTSAFGNYHKFKAGTEDFFIPDYFSLNKVFGNGAYGVAISAADRFDKAVPRRV